LGFVIKRVDVRRSALHAQEDDSFGRWFEMGRLG
jgi:hypothetical protein